MQTVIIVFLILNTLLLAGLLTALFLRSRDTDDAHTAKIITDQLYVLKQELRQEHSTQRSELQQALSLSHQQIAIRVTEGSDAQATELGREREARATQNRELRELLDQSINERLNKTLKTSLEENAQRVTTLTQNNDLKQEELKKTLERSLEKLREGNEKKLDQMRNTVDEKLQGTLEKRLGESFSLVSERLEQVQKGLGEMQTLASDVGGLKRVLTNVKSRGGWGEVQLARQLEDLMTSDQYVENAVVKPGSSERVEFAIKMPGGDDGQPVYLPIDSKLPQEDYERLLDAQDGGDPATVEQAHKVLDRVLTEQAKLIASKYIDPPNTTDFAIMYLPTEGLFAEALRRPGLANKLQQDMRVMIMGPTTLGSILTSLQMGFRTLAIEKRSSEVWQVLGEAKAEFSKYGAVWDKLGKQLKTAQNTVEEAGRRTRAVERKLRDVETYEIADAPHLTDELDEEFTEDSTEEFTDELITEELTDESIASEKEKI